jgi:hypothetical protein
MDPVIPCPNDDNAMRTRKSSKVIDLFGVSKMAFIASPVFAERRIVTTMWFTSAPNKGLLPCTDSSPLSGLRLSVFAPATSARKKISRAILRVDRLRTSLHVVFTELA